MFEVKKNTKRNQRTTHNRNSNKNQKRGKTTMIPIIEKHEYITYLEISDKIEETKTRLKNKGEATTTFKRQDYPEIFSILGSDPLLSDRQVHVKLNLQGGLVTLYLRKMGI